MRSLEIMRSIFGTINLESTEKRLSYRNNRVCLGESGGPPYHRPPPSPPPHAAVRPILIGSAGARSRFLRAVVFLDACTGTFREIKGVLIFRLYAARV